MRRGDVYWIELQPRSGAEQQGPRPAIVVSHDGFNEVKNWRPVIIVPCTTLKKQAMRGPTSVLLSRGAGGLRSASTALCHQVTTVDRAKLTKKLGTLSDGDLEAVDRGLRAAMDLGA